MSWRRATPAITPAARLRWPPFGDVIEAGLAKGKLIGKEDF
jgi:hypothetical protein